jgi:glycosyltransferase involved in cell wall biosynthesis
MSLPPLTIVDFQSGRGFGGHYEDYLAALQSALSEYSPETIAPFHDGAPVPGRVGIYRVEFAGYRRALKRGGAVVVHSGDFSDYVSLWAAARTIRRKDRAVCLFVLRRSPTPDSMATGNVHLVRGLIRLVAGMIRRGVIHPVSDSAPALEAWLKLAPGVSGELVALPPAPGVDVGEIATVSLPAPDGPLVAIAGRMRTEKGAANYPVVVDAALAALPDGAIALQTAEDDEASRAALAEIRARHGDDPRVALLGAHLSPADYAALLKAADIVVLPYEIAVYGTGTSGVVSDGLTLGAVVVVSPIEWVVQTYADDPRVILLEDPTSVDSVREAIALAATRIGEAHAGEDAQAKFAASWQAAVASALR